MAKAKKKNVRRPAPKAPAFPTSSLAPQVLEQAAQGWLQSSGAPTPAPRPPRSPSDLRLTNALVEFLQELRTEITELRTRIEKLENR